jgi:hypothetical protein
MAIIVNFAVLFCNLSSFFFARHREMFGCDSSGRLDREDGAWERLEMVNTKQTLFLSWKGI